MKQLDNFKALMIKHKDADMPFDWRLFPNDESAWNFLEEKLKHWSLADNKKEDYELVEVEIIPIFR